LLPDAVHTPSSHGRGECLQVAPQMVLLYCSVLALECRGCSKAWARVLLLLCTLGRWLVCVDTLQCESEAGMRWRYQNAKKSGVHRIYMSRVEAGWGEVELENRLMRNQGWVRSAKKIDILKTGTLLTPSHRAGSATVPPRSISFFAGCAVHDSANGGARVQGNDACPHRVRDRRCLPEHENMNSPVAQR